MGYGRGRRPSRDNVAVSPTPPPGWYDDPEHAGMLRYWDGTAWTPHRAPPPPARAASSSTGLSDIGDWLTQTFRGLWARRAPLAAVVVVSVIVSWLVSFVLVDALDSLVFDDGDWSGVDEGALWRAGLGVVAATLVAGVMYMVAVHQLYHARLGVHQGFGASLDAALRSLPRAIGWTLLLVAGAVVVMIVLGVALALAPALGVLLVIALVPAVVWVGVKLAFLLTAYVVPVEGMHPIRASAEVSAGRWWGVFGRILLLGLIGLMLSLAINVVTSAIDPGLDPDTVDRYLVTEGDEVVYFDIGGLIDELDLTGPAGVLTALPGLLVALYQLSGLCVLYAETHQVRPASPAP